MFTVARINRLNGGRTTGDTIRLLFDIAGLLVLGNLCVNGLVSLYTISVNFRVTQARNNFALSRIRCINRFRILDVALIAECYHALRHVNSIATFATKDYHAIFGNFT